MFLFPPKGAVIKLPKNATPIDFAYAVHTKVGNSAIGCTVNGSHSTLQTILKNGDLVNIETSKNASPSLHWLSSSATGKARSVFVDIGKINLPNTQISLKKTILVQ